MLRACLAFLYYRFDAAAADTAAGSIKYGKKRKAAQPLGCAAFFILPSQSRYAALRMLRRLQHTFYCVLQ